MRIQTVVVDGVRSPVACVGDATRDEAVVFLHGNPGAKDDWDDLLPRVGAFARAIAPDMPGYGKADRPRRFDFTVRGYARHLAGILDQLGIRRAHLVLHDFGGPWGLQWASEHPERVASVTLFNMGIMPGYRWHKFARIWRTPLLGELFQLTTTRAALGLFLNRDNGRPFPQRFIDRIYDDADWGHKRAVLALYRATSDLEGESRRLAAALAPLKLPLLVLWGENDAYVPVRYAEVQKQYFDAEVHTLANCGHWPMVDEPEVVAGLVIPFLRKHVS